MKLLTWSKGDSKQFQGIAQNKHYTTKLATNAVRETKNDFKIKFARIKRMHFTDKANI